MDLSIGQMARITHVTIQTLRLYDRLGLLKPAHVDQETGYRYYSILQCAKLDLIQNMKLCGLSLKEIKDYFEKGDMARLEQGLRAEKDRVREEIRRLNDQEAAIKRTLASIEQYQSTPPGGTITLEYIPKRTIISLDSGCNYFEEGLEGYEYSLLQLKHTLADRNMDHLYYRNPGTIWRKDRLLNREFTATEVYVLVDPEDFSPEEVTVIPAGMYQCIYCDCFVNEKDYALRLLDQIQANGYAVSGDYLCETIVETPMFDKDERGMFLRLQIPVTIY